MIRYAIHRKPGKLAIRAVMIWALFLAPAAVPANPQDFTLQAVGGPAVFTLSKAKGRYVALHFLLKTECPFCLRLTHEYAVNAGKVPGVDHVFVKPDAEADIRKWIADLDGDTSGAVTVYRDPDAKLADAFGVPNGYAFHGQTVHYPAFILLDPRGAEVFRYVGKKNTDRFHFADFEKKMTELRGK